LRVAVFQRTERPVEKIYIGVDDSNDPGGAGDMGLASRRLCRHKSMAGERNSRGAQEGISQKTASIDGLHARNDYVGQSKHDVHTLLTENRCANPPQISAEDFHSIGL